MDGVTIIGYRFRGSALGQALHSLKVRVASRKLDKAERLLREAVHEINIHAIVSPQAAALFRAAEAFDARINRGY